MSGNGVATTKLRGDAEGRYFGRVWIGGTPGTGTRVGQPATVDALGVWTLP